MMLFLPTWLRLSLEHLRSYPMQWLKASYLTYLGGVGIDSVYLCFHATQFECDLFSATREGGLRSGALHDDGY